MSAASKDNVHHMSRKTSAKKTTTKRSGSETPTTEETKRQKFERIGTARMNRVLNSIRLLGNLASSNYEWVEEDIARIQHAIEDQLDASIARFRKSKRGTKPQFAFTPGEDEGEGEAS